MDTLACCLVFERKAQMGACTRCPSANNRVATSDLCFMLINKIVMDVVELASVYL